MVTKMKFNFLYNKTYDSNILSTYYASDDTMTNNVRNIYHPQQLKNGKFFGIIPYNSLYSDSLFNTYGIRI